MDTSSVVFVDGVHYALVIGQDGVTEADMDRPLTWTPNGFIDREENHPLHNEQFGTRSLTELIPGSE